jgi:hypothetical protein
MTLLPDNGRILFYTYFFFEEILDLVAIKVFGDDLWNAKLFPQKNMKKYFTLKKGGYCRKIPLRALKK